MSVVQQYNGQPVQAQCDHKAVLDGKETKHLVEDSEVNNDSQPDQQKRPILDKEGLYDTPNISAVFNKEGFPDNLIFSAILFIRFGVHHYVE